MKDSSKLVMVQDKAGCRLIYKIEGGCDIVEQTFCGRVEMKIYSKLHSIKWGIPLYNRKLNGLEVLCH